VRHFAAIALAPLSMLVFASVASGAPQPGPLCASAVELAASKLAQCRLKAESVHSRTGDATKRAAALAKCSTKFGEGFDRAVARYGANCPMIESKETFDGFLTQCADATAAAADGAFLPGCGNDAIDAAGEQCDGTDLGGETCETLGFLSGTLGCDGCRLDTTSCVSTLCGNDAIDGDEQCDGADLGGASCETLGYESGTLGCSAGCAFETSGCAPFPAPTCGNGVVDGLEQCDGAELAGETCVTLGYARGTLACGAGCAFATGACEGATFPATGQTTCWDATGTVIPCAGTGQDGDIQAGAPLAYVDNGDGTVSDSNTGLTWEKLDDESLGGIHDKDDTYTWEDAVTVKIAALNTPPCFAGHCDWRLPSLKELLSIADYEVPFPGPTVRAAFETGCVPGCTSITCSCTAPDFYWSSTTYAGSPQFAWYVVFFDGNVLANPKDTLGYVRAVRGGE